MKQIFNYQNFYTLLFFFPLTFILGIAVAELFVFVFLFFLILNFNQKKILFDKKFLTLFFFSFYIALNAIFQITDDLKYSSLFHFRYVLFSMAIFLFYEKFFNQKFDIKLYYVFLLIILILIFDSFFQFIIGYNMFGNKIDGQRISSFFGDELVLGSYLIRLLPILIWYIYSLNINLSEKKYFYTFFFGAYFCVIYLSGERTSLALFLIFFLLILFFIDDLKKIFIRSFVFFLMFVFSIIFFNYGKSDVTNRVFNKTYNQIFQEEKKTNIEYKNVYDRIKNSKIIIFSKDHQGHLILAKKLFFDNLIIGSGPKGFRHYCRKVNYKPNIGICSTHPHNLLAQISAELGLIGIIFFLILFIFLIKEFLNVFFLKNKSNHHYAFLVASLGILINLFPILPSGNFFNNWISIFIYFNLGLYLVSYKKVKSE